MTKTFTFVGDPFAVFREFHGRRGLFFLDSSQRGSDGQFSYLGFSPFKTVTGSRIGKLKEEFQKHRRRAGLAPVAGGAVGYLSYDGSFHFGFYDQVMTFDHGAQTVTVAAPTRAKIDLMEDALERTPPYSHVLGAPRAKFTLKSNFNKRAYVSAVKKALEHIRQGDIYQINLSRKVEARFKDGIGPDPIALYGVLRKVSPSPFSAYFDGGPQTILSSSPERFLRLSKGIAQVKPMKGTRPRGMTKADDACLKSELLKSPKEKAELLMVTDLERNDLGRVCSYGSVKVKAMRTIETYSTVFQATATIEGKLRQDKDVFDLLEATFPSGSVTGCPKIEAMKIIKELEGHARGAYTGALGYIGFDGDADLSVIIRALFLKGNRATFHVGGGIVTDSDPEAEYEETCVKAKAIEAALKETIRG